MNALQILRQRQPSPRLLEKPRRLSAGAAARTWSRKQHTINPSTAPPETPLRVHCHPLPCTHYRPCSIYFDQPLLKNASRETLSLFLSLFVPGSLPTQAGGATRSPNRCFGTKGASPAASADAVTSSVVLLLQDEINGGRLHCDRAQLRAAHKLERLQQALLDYDNEPIVQFQEEQEENHIRQVKEENGEGSRKAGCKEASPSDDFGAARRLVPRGLYLHGDVGTGKTMLMDLFFSSLTTVIKKRRCHFYEFMADVHDRIHQLKQNDLEVNGRSFSINTTMAKNPIYRVGFQLSKELAVLCLDEFQGRSITLLRVSGRI